MPADPPSADPCLTGVIRFVAVAILLALPDALLYAEPADERTRQRYSDGHLHFVDFFQETDGVAALLEALDAAAVDHALLAGLPVMKMWADSEPQKPKYVFADDAKVYWYSLTDVIVARAITGLPEAQRRRLHPFLCGFNPIDKNAVEHVKRMLEWYPELWQGIGEIMTRHDDLTALTYGEPARANHPALAPIYRLAAAHDLPVLIHSNITSVRIEEPLYLSEFEEALREHPKTRFIWAHAGTSAEINERIDLDFLDDEVERLLATYNNLWIDLSWSMLEEHLMETRKRVSRRWIRIIRRHPERFMLGSDVVGRFDRIGEILGSYDELLEALGPELAERVARRNFLDVLPRRVRRDDH